MSLESIFVSLRGTAGKSEPGTLFFDLLSVSPADGFKLSPSDNPHKAARLVVLELERGHHPQRLSSEQCAEQIKSQFLRAAEWLSSRPSKTFENCRAQGFDLDVFISLWIENDQVDLDVPPEFLLACGQAGLPIAICSND